MSGRGRPDPARRPEPGGAREAARPPRAAAAATPSARALGLQRAVGNRAATALLARWRRHPDPEQKGVMVPDVVEDEHTHFNPPQNA
ncbi:hypothetical protein FSW04_13440 [Baekduia soli]|uniref:Uncharacterized protein n=1 Tax=Baekduia soli TaxID=496014 RepID=A0A5B8U732_9ACTN|nr:hypothetical protein [Baekduia soli]QEC48472.1 hypothetical protein FSW04_13440 [Baekduia soli]